MIIIFNQSKIQYFSTFEVIGNLINHEVKTLGLLLPTSYS